jgi:hypothetical protein
MDLLPGPDEDAAVARVRPILEAHLGPEAWRDRLARDAPLPDPIAADLCVAAGAARTVTQAALVALALGHALAPVEALAALILTDPESGGPDAPPPGAPGARLAMAVARADGGFTRIGPADARGVLVWTDAGVAWADATPGPAVPGVDPTTPLGRVTCTGVRPLGPDVTDRGRLVVAGALAGHAEGAQALAVDHATRRMQFGRPIGANQAIKHRLADCATRTEAARATVAYAATATAEDHPDRGFWIASAARVALDAADANARAAVQVHGGRGYTFECPAHVHLARTRLLGTLLGGAPGIRAGLAAAAPDL